METSKSLLFQKRTVIELSDHEMTQINGGVETVLLAAGSLIVTGVATIVINQLVVQSQQQSAPMCPNDPYAR